VDPPRLIFVYNANAGLLAGMMDSIHKLVSPATYVCKLCALTHGLFTMDPRWRDWLRRLPLPATFHHKQDFEMAHPAARFALPVILLEQPGNLQEFVSAAEMNACADVDALMTLLGKRLEML
jgi:hypothetical protein